MQSQLHQDDALQQVVGEASAIKQVRLPKVRGSRTIDEGAISRDTLKLMKHTVKVPKDLVAKN